jgi:TrmH family RNA methyltransferase
MLSRSESSLFHGLRQRKNRADTGLFLAEGLRVAEELAGSGVDLHLAVVSTSVEDTPRGAALVHRLEQRVRTERVSDAELAKLAATDAPQGVVVAARIPAASRGSIAFGDRAVCLLLDAVQDPGNFGTLVRSCDAFGAVAVVALPGTVDAWNPKAVRAAAGSSFRVPILQLTLEDAAAWLRAHGFRIAGADPDGRAIEHAPLPGRVALIVGNEGAGLGAGSRRVADELLAVPTPGPAESLNVAVAAGILLYLLTRER